MTNITAMIDHFLSPIVTEKHVAKMTRDKHKTNDHFVIFLGCYQLRKLQ